MTARSKALSGDYTSVFKDSELGGERQRGGMTEEEDKGVAQSQLCWALALHAGCDGATGRF